MWHMTVVPRCVPDAMAIVQTVAKSRKRKNRKKKFLVRRRDNALRYSLSRIELHFCVILWGEVFSFQVKFKVFDLLI